MCKSLVRRVGMVALVLLFTVGVAASQTAPLPFQNNIAWGGPVQPPDVGSGDNRTQPVTSSGVNGGAPAETSADNPGQTPGDTPAGSTAGDTTSSLANNAASANPDNTIRQLGTPFPLQLQPEGLKIGPFHVPSISDSFFYAVNTSPGQPTQTFYGNSVMANLFYSKQLSNGVFAVQAREQLSITQGRPYFNQAVLVNFNDQLTARWSLTAGASFVYFQNSFLSNPQYLLSSQNSGIVQQTLFVQQQSYNIYETNNISLNYSMGERWKISFSPIIGATFQYLDGGWSNVHNLGGGVTISRQLNSNLSISGFYSLYNSSTAGAASTSSGWLNQNMGVSFNGTFLQYRGWALGGSAYLSSQRYQGYGGYTLTPAGSLTLRKSFGGATILAAYTRTEASNVLVANGYFDQGDVAYNQGIGRRVFVNANAGVFRTSNTGFHQHGNRVGGGVTYQWLPRLSVNANYNFANQNGGYQVSSFSPFLGNVSYFSFGLTWTLGSGSGL